MVPLAEGHVARYISTVLLRARHAGGSRGRQVIASLGLFGLEIVRRCPFPKPQDRPSRPQGHKLRPAPSPLLPATHLRQENRFPDGGDRDEVYRGHKLLELGFDGRTVQPRLGHLPGRGFFSLTCVLVMQPRQHTDVAWSLGIPLLLESLQAVKTVQKGLEIRELVPGQEAEAFNFAAEMLPDSGLWGSKSKGLRSREEFDRLVRLCNREPNRTRWLMVQKRRKAVGFAALSQIPYRRESMEKRLGYDPRCGFVMAFGDVDGDLRVMRASVESMRTFLKEEGLVEAIYPAVDLPSFTTVDVNIADLDRLCVLRQAGFEGWDLRYLMALEDLSKTALPDICDLVESLEGGPGLVFHSFPSSIQALVKMTVGDIEPQAPMDLHNPAVAGDIDWDLSDGSADLGIFVKEKWRGRRVGTALLGLCLRELAERRIRRVQVSVDGNNLGAIRLYRKYHFEPNPLRTSLYLAIRARGSR